jgi:enterochelin esterase-like enzyme
MKPLIPIALAAAFAATAIMAIAQSPAQPAPPQKGPAAPAPKGPDPNSQYRLGPDSMPQPGVPQGEIRGPFTLASNVYPGTQHTYWVYVPAQYDPAVPASLMIFQDGQAFKAEDGDIHAQHVMDNLIYRREIPVMIGVFINPGRRPDQPEPTLQEWGDRTTNRPAEYNTPDDKYARIVVDELMPALYKDYNISKDPEQHGIGGSSSGAIAAFMVAWERPNDFRKVLSNVGSFVNLRGGNVYPERVLAADKKPLRVFLCDGRNDNRIRRDARLVFPERPADEGADRERLRRELLMGDESPRPEIRRRDPARNDALAVARRPGLHRPERYGGAQFSRAGEVREKKLMATDEHG